METYTVQGSEAGQRMDNQDLAENSLSPRQKRLLALAASLGGSEFVTRLTVRLAGVGDARLLHSALEMLLSRNGLLHPTVPGADPGGVRATIAPGGGGELRVTLEAPSVLADLRSLEIVTGELCSMLAGGAPVDPVDFASYAAWLQAVQLSEDAAGELEYWRRMDLPALAAARPVFSATRVRGAFVPRAVPVAISEELSRASTSVAARDGLAPGAFELACWCAVLTRVCGPSDFAVAVCLDGRIMESCADGVGPFAMHVPIRVTWDPERSVSELRSSVDGWLKEAAERQEYFDLAGVLPSVATDAEALLMPMGFEFRESLLHAGPMQVLRENEHACSEYAELRLVCRREHGHLSAEIHFDSLIVDQQYAEALGVMFTTVMEASARDALQRVAELPLLPDGHISSLQQAVRRTKAEHRSVDELIMAQARATPESIAVRSGDQSLSYAELCIRAARVARGLSARGVARGDVVGVHLDRGLFTHVSLLGIWLVGAAFLPLEVDLPKERVSFMVDDCGIGVVVTQHEHVAHLPEGLTLLLLDADVLEREAPLERALGGGELAYVLYTSGTSGNPNGVRVGHRSLANYLCWAAKEFEVSALDTSLMHSPLGFDLSLTALLVPLIVGGTVEMLAEQAAIETLVEMLGRNEYGMVKVTPSHIEAMTRLSWSHGGFGRTKVLVVGGEELRPEPVQAIRRRLQGVRVVNEYGPTEATVGCTSFAIPVGWRGRVPIGIPIDNAQVFALDPCLRPLPVGAVGELFVAGECLALGYHNRPEVEAARFVRPTSASGLPARLYRTGDLAFRTPEHNWVYVGRIDQQLKIRGVRIEPGEVESALRAHPAVSEAVVMAEELPLGGRGLAAFITTNSEPLTAGELTSFLRTRLPGQLVPSNFYVIGTIPLTPNGKLDRSALLASRRVQLEEGSEFVAPQNPIEETLAAIWAKVLNRQHRIGIDDNYFALGGDSIRSIRIVGESLAAGLNVTVADVHRFATIRSLAAAVSGVSTSDAPHVAIAPFELVNATDLRLVPPDVEDAYPLNLLQEGMIYHRSFSPKSAVYHAMISLQLQAPFDLAAMRRVIRNLVARHPLLRTSFDLHHFSVPLQLVHKAAGDPLQFEDLSDLPAAQHRQSVLHWMEAEKERGFEVDGYPLIRFMLHRLTSGTFQLTFSYHHEIVDGWSEASMLTEVLDHYMSIVHGAEQEPQRPLASFRDSVALELEALRDDRFAEFWNRRMQGATLMRLPRLISGPKPDRGEREIVKIWVPFSFEIASGARRLADSLSVPVKSVLLAAHLRVMAMFGGHSDVVTHMVSQGRPEDTDGAKVIGLFVNSFTVRQNLPGGTWRDLILDTHRSELETLPFRRYPMAELKRHQGRDPLSETLFFLIDYHVYDQLQKWGDAKLLDVMIYGESTFPFCATFRVPPLTSDLQMQIEYDSLQFSAELIDSIIASYKAALSAIIEHVDGEYFGTDLLAPAEENKLLQLWKGASSLDSEVACIHELFEERASTAGDAVAVVHGELHLTYAYLNDMANSIAAEVSRRVEPTDSVIGVLMRRSPEMIAAMLGILKSGHAYLPLDVGQKPERLAHMVRESAAGAVLTHAGLSQSSGGFDDVPLVEMNASELGRRAANHAPPPSAGGDSVAYVIYTSGSTGHPKGVVVPHKALVHSTRARLAYYGPYSRFLLLSSQAFDSSVAGIFGTLCGGGTLLLPPEGATASTAGLLDIIERERATQLLCIPSLYAALLDEAREDNPSLVDVIVAGEACGAGLWAKHRAFLPNGRIYNEYGPTECTVWSTVWGGEPDGWRSELPIGRPIADTHLFVLGPGSTIVPIGVQGELHIGGPGVANGYVADPALTAARFVPDPRPAVAGARMYRSGDLVRYRSDGQLEFLGRVDHQVKVRGFRVEPQEIESALDAHPMVQRAVVQARDDANGDKVLVAYLVAKRGCRLDLTDVKSYAAGRLPKYMCPASFVTIDSVPVTHTGKVDRSALPAGSSDTSDRVHTPPRNPTEQVLAAIWTDILGLESVGIQESFLDLGGESLRAMRVMARVRKAFDVELPPHALLEPDATIAHLAEAIQRARWVAENARLSALEVGDESEEGML